jgi:hypothetical protein
MSIFLEPRTARGEPTELPSTALPEHIATPDFIVVTVVRPKIGTRNIRFRRAVDVPPHVQGGREVLAYHAVDELLPTDIPVYSRCGRCGREMHVTLSDTDAIRGECAVCLTVTRTGKPARMFPAGA